MAAKLLTTEEKNYLRSIYLTFMIGTDAVRTYFDQLHPPTDLVAHLANNKSAFESLKKDGIISKAMWEKLYPKRGASPTSAEFDITILIFLLRDLTPKVAAPRHTGFDQLPRIADKSPGACLANIKYYRNFLGHPDKVKLRTLSCTTFGDLFTRVGMAISVLGNNQLCGKVAVAKQLNIDNDFAEYLEKFVKHDKQLEDLHKVVQQISKDINHLQTLRNKSEDKSDELENELRCLEKTIEKMISDITSNSNLCKQPKETIERNVKDIRKQLIQTNATQTLHGEQILNLEQGLDSLSKQQGDNSEKIKKLNEQKLSIKGLHQNTVQKWRSRKVYKTKAMNCVLDLLNTNNAVTVIGPQGIGKTTSLHCVALKMEEQGYELVPAQSAGDILHLYEQNTKQLFIFDDVCGKGVLQRHLLDAWQGSLDKIRDILEKDNVRILVSSQSSVYSSLPFRKISIFTKCPYMLKALSKREKNGIAELYMSKSEANTLLEEDHVHERLDFPLLCSMYQMTTMSNEENLQNIDVKTFFSKSDMVIKKELEFLMKADDQSMFAVLMLFVFCNNHVDIDLFSMNFDILQYVSRNITYFLEIWHPCHCITYNDMFSIIEDKSMINILDEMSRKMNLSCRLREICKKCKQSELPKSVLKKELRALMKVFLNHVKGNETINYEHECVVYMLEVVLSKKLHFEQVIEVFNKEFKLSFLLSKNNVEEQLCILTDSYVSKCQHYKSGYTIVNDRLLDILMAFCRENLLKLFLSYGHSKMIGDKLIIQSSSNNISTRYDCSEQKFLVSYFKRLVYDICNGDFIYVLENSQLKNKKLCKLFAKYLSENFDAKDALISFEKNDYTSPLRKAALEGLTSIVAVLLDFQLDIESADKENATPLIEAVRGGNYDTLGLLIEKGADCNKELSGIYNEGYTALYIAAESGNKQIVQLLLENTAIVNCRNVMETSLLKSPVLYGFPEIVELILKNGANPDQADLTTSLIYYAVYHGNKEIAEILLNYNANPNIGDNLESEDMNCMNTTPLMVAAKTNNIEIMEVLLCHKTNPANPNHYNSFGETALYIAAEIGYLEIVQLLLKHYADPSISTGDGDTAYSKAREACHEDIVKILSEHVMDTEIPKFAEIPNTRIVSRREQIDEESSNSSDIFEMLYGPDITIH